MRGTFHARDSTQEVAGTLAHDFNNVLTVISGNLSLAERHAAGNPKLIRLLNNIRIATDRASALTGELMTISALKSEMDAGETAELRVLPPAAKQVDRERRSRILVVEDDPDVAEVAAAVLENMGHDVEVCADATSALARIKRVQDFHLVFSDIMMPGPMNGIDLAEAIINLFPDLPVLLATGYSNAALAPGALRFPVLAKPYSVRDLTGRVGQMLIQSQ